MKDKPTGGYNPAEEYRRVVRDKEYKVMDAGPYRTPAELPHTVPISDVLHQRIDLARTATRLALAELKPEQRVAFHGELFAGYCVHCGEKKDWICHCQNDE